MKKQLPTVVAAGLLAAAESAPAQTYGTYLDWTTLGADVTQIISGGQTFTDIGTTLGFANLVGVDLDMVYTHDGVGSVRFTINGLTDDGNPSTNVGDLFGLGDGTVTLTFSEPVWVSQEGWGNLVAGEFNSYGSAGSGTLVSSHPEAGLVVTDDSLLNPTGSRITTGDQLWDGSVAGTTWSRTADNGSFTGRFAASTIPEPSSALLAGLVGTGLLLRRRRR